MSGHLHAGPVDSEAGEAEADCCTVISEHRATLRLLASVWVGLLLLLLLRGGKGLPSLLGFPTCGAAYWALTALAVGGLALCSVLAGRSLVGRSRALSGMSYSKGDVRWSPAVAADALARTAVAGVMAGLMGVGGGIVLGPMMLQLGMLPQVSSATTALMVLLTSSCAAFGFVSSGVAPLSYAVPLGALTLGGGFLGKQLFSKLVKQYRCASLITLLLGGLIAASVVAVAVAGTLDMLARVEAGQPLRHILTFQHLCAA